MDTVVVSTVFELRVGSSGFDEESLHHSRLCFTFYLLCVFTEECHKINLF